MNQVSSRWGVILDSMLTDEHCLPTRYQDRSRYARSFFGILVN
jgi:hypothetical protein